MYTQVSADEAGECKARMQPATVASATAPRHSWPEGTGKTKRREDHVGSMPPGQAKGGTEPSHNDPTLDHSNLHASYQRSKTSNRHAALQSGENRIHAVHLDQNRIAPDVQAICGPLLQT